MLSEMRVAVCGDLPTLCNMLRKEGVSRIDRYADSIDLSVRLRRGEKYHLILVHAPQGAGLGTTEYAYKTALDGDWLSVPVRLREWKERTALGEVLVKLFSDGGSTPPASTKE